jgi:uncharacterized protein (DUF1015 family)
VSFSIVQLFLKRSILVYSRVYQIIVGEWTAKEKLFLPLVYQCMSGEISTGVISHSPVGYFTGAIKNHSRGVSHGNYFAWRK